MTIELDLQAAVVSRITTETAYQAYDTVPQVAVDEYGASYPLFTVSSTTFTPLLTDELDKHSAAIIVQSWSTRQGVREIYQLQGAAYQALHNRLLTVNEYGNDTPTVSFDNFLLFRENSQVFPTEDGTLRGACTYRALIQLP